MKRENIHREPVRRHRVIRWMASPLVFIAVAAIFGCASETSPTRGVYMLLDASCNYAAQLDKAGTVVNYVLTILQSGDSLAVSRIDTDTGSFSQKDRIAMVSFDQRPSVINNQKRAFKHKVDSFIATAQGGDYTDISGGILQAVEYLNSVKPEKKYILIFSDLWEELPSGRDERDALFRLSGFEVIVLSFAGIRPDGIPPELYQEQVRYWREQIVQSEGVFRMINDLEHLDRIFSN